MYPILKGHFTLTKTINKAIKCLYNVHLSLVNYTDKYLMMYGVVSNETKLLENNSNYKIL